MKGYTIEFRERPVRVCSTNLGTLFEAIISNGNESIYTKDYTEEARAISVGKVLKEIEERSCRELERV